MRMDEDADYAQEEAERRQSQKYVPWIDPRDPDYISEDEEDE